MGSNVSGVGRLGSGECSWDLRAFPLVFLTAKNENRSINCELGCKGKSIPKKLSLSSLRIVPSYKRVREHNTFKSEHLILK